MKQKDFCHIFIYGGITLVASPLSQKPMVSKEIFGDVIILQCNCLGHFYTFNKFFIVSARGGVEDTRLEAKDTKKSEAKDSPSEDRHSRGQGQECSRPRTKDTAASVL